MTRGFHTAEHLPYEGVLLQEWPTKKEAENHYNQTLKQVNEEGLLGAALIYIEVVKEKGDWRSK